MELHEFRDDDVPPPPAPAWRRVAWFAAIWVISILALGAVAYIIKLFIG